MAPTECLLSAFVLDSFLSSCLLRTPLDSLECCYNSFSMFFWGMSHTHGRMDARRTLPLLGLLSEPKNTRVIVSLNDPLFWNRRFKCKNWNKKWPYPGFIESVCSMKLSGNPRAVVSWYCYISNGHFEFYFTSLMLKRLMFVIPSLLFNDIIMTQVPYLTWILDLHFNITEGSFKDTFTFVFFCFEALFPIWSKKQTCTHFSADFFYWSTH